MHGTKMAGSNYERFVCHLNEHFTPGAVSTRLVDTQHGVAVQEDYESDCGKYVTTITLATRNLAEKRDAWLSAVVAAAAYATCETLRVKAALYSKRMLRSKA